LNKVNWRGLAHSLSQRWQSHGQRFSTEMPLTPLFDVLQALTAQYSSPIENQRGICHHRAIRQAPAHATEYDLHQNRQRHP